MPLPEKMNKKKILWVTPYFFIPPDSGSKIRMWNLYKYPSKELEIFIISFYEKKRIIKSFHFRTFRDRLKYGENARKVAEKYDWKIIAENLKKFYRKFIKENEKL